MKFLKPFTFLVCTAFFASNSLVAQVAWSLEDCINHAMENNLSIQQTQLNQDLAENTLFQSKMNLYTPNVNANVSHNFNFSNSIDPLTYDFVQETTQSTQMSLSGSYNLFEGLGRLNTIKANQKDLEASQYDIEDIKNNTQLLIANNYLQILVANEVLQIANERQLLTQNQLNNTSQLVEAGVQARGDLLEIEAQHANDATSIVNAEINLEKAMNQLKLVLQLDPYEEFAVEGIAVQQDIDVAINSPQSITADALTILPNLQASQTRLESAKYQLKSAKGSLSPTISISGNMGTNYFSAAREAVGFENVSFPTIGTVQSSGESVVSTTPSGDVVFGDKSFGQQFSDNMNQGLSIGMSIPIFGKWQRMTAIDNAKISIARAELDIVSKENDIKQDVFNAYTDVTASSKKYEAADKSVTAAAEAFRYADEKMKAGIVNSLEFETAKNRLTVAKADKVQAKYEYIFRKMILTFYQSGELKL